MNTRSVILALTLALTSATGQVAAQSFSIDIPSPGITPPVPGDAILGPGPVVASPPPPPTIALPAPILVAGAGAGLEVDAFSYDVHSVFAPDGANFGVGPGSAGVAGSAVMAESGGDEVADLYYSAFTMTNVLTHDGNGSSGTPLGLPEPAFANLDAADMTVPPPALGSVTVLFSVDGATAAGPYGGASPADIFAAPNGPGYSLPGGMPPGVYAAAATLGLMAADDVDALFWMEDGMAGATAGDMVFFSLAPGSPSLGGLGASAADILVTSPGGAPAVAHPAAAIGLVGATDNLDALDMHAPGEGFPVELQSFAIE